MVGFYFVFDYLQKMNITETTQEQKHTTGKLLLENNKTCSRTLNAQIHSSVSSHSQSNTVILSLN